MDAESAERQSSYQYGSVLNDLDQRTDGQVPTNDP